MKITLNNVADLTSTVTSAQTINNNSNTIQVAFDNTLSRDGTNPNQMNAPIDMNSNQIVNLPAPQTVGSPLRLKDLNTFIGGGIITSIPPGGTTGQSLQKTDGVDYHIGWGNNVSSVGLSLPPGDFTISNSPVTSTGTLTATWTTTPTGTGAVVRATSPALTTPTLSTPTLTTPVINGLSSGTGVSTSATANTIALRDASGNITYNNLIRAYTTTATAGGTTTLSVTSTYYQFFTGVTTQTVVMPVTSTLTVGQTFFIDNNSTGAVTAQSSGLNNIIIIAPGTTAIITCILNTGTTAASWNALYIAEIPATGKSLTYTNTLTLSGTDGTVMTFPSTSATVARTDAANTFTGHQTIEGVTSTGATGTGNLVFSTTPTFITSIIDPLVIGGTATSSTLTLQSTSGVGATDSMLFQTGSQSTRMAILSGGNIGMGKETNPQSTVVVSNNATTGISNPANTALAVNGADGGAAIISFQSFGTGQNPVLAMRAARGTSATPTASQAGDVLGFMSAVGNTGPVYDTANPSGIYVGALNNHVAATDNTTFIAFLNVPSGTARSEAARFQSGFSVGTTTDPGAGGILANTSIKSQGPTAGIGYATGAGGTVTQGTGRTTGVTLNKVSGSITLFSQVNSAVSAATAQTFTLTNSNIVATDVVHVTQQSGTDKYEIFVNNTGSGSCQITNYTTGGTTNEAPVFNFVVIKGVTS